MICSFQVRCLSTRTPTDFVLTTSLIGKSLRTKFGEFSNVCSLCHDPININSVLDLLRVNLLATSQPLTLIRSWFSVNSIFSMLLLANVRCVSSTYIRLTALARQFGRSLIHSIKSNGPKIVPWGMPQVREIAPERETFTDNLWVRLYASKIWTIHLWCMRYYRYWV